MIGLIRGQIHSRKEGHCCVMVGSARSAVGYEVRVPISSRYAQLSPGTDVDFFVHTHVREDSFELFGFLSSEERELFLTLLAVSGVGPRLALTFLSGGSIEELVRAVVTGDIAFLTRTPGVGRKTAERIVLEVSDNLRKKMESGRISGISGKNNAPSQVVPAREDAKLALLGLGYREAEADRLLDGASRVFEKDTKTAHVEEWIRTALRQAQQL